MSPLPGSWKGDGLDTDGKATWSAKLRNGNNSNGDSQPFSELDIAVTGGSPMSLCYIPSTQDFATTNYYFQIDVLEKSSASASLSVGVVRPSEFHKGYRTKGMFYNGNLTNGGAALRTNYGPRLQQGDVIIVEYQQVLSQGVPSNVQVQLSFYLNGVSLGMGFAVSIQDEMPSGTLPFVFIPCFQVKGEVKVATKVATQMPMVATVSTPFPLSGKWILLQAFYEEDEEGNTSTSPSTVPIWPLPNFDAQENNDVELEISLISTGQPEPPGTATELALSLKVCNVLRISKTVHSQIDSGMVEKNSNNTGSIYHMDRGGNVAMTRMRAPPPFDVLEMQLSKCMQSQWHMWHLTLRDGKEELVIYSNSKVPLAKLQRKAQQSTCSLTSYK